MGQSMMGGSLSPNKLFVDRTHSLSSMEMTCDEQSTMKGSTRTKNQKARAQHAKPRVSKKANVVDKGNPTQKWIATKGNGVGTAREFRMEIGEFRAFSTRGSSTAMDQGSKGRLTQLVDGGTMRMEEKRSPLLEISKYPGESKSVQHYCRHLLKLCQCQALKNPGL